MCTNHVSYWFQRSWSRQPREYFVRCGNTDPYGGRAICDTCSSDPATMAEIDRHERTIAEDNAASHSAGWGDW